MSDNNTLISFSPNTVIKSADMNSNLNILNGVGQASLFVGSFSYMSIIAVAGSGVVSHGLTVVPQIVLTTKNDWAGTGDNQFMEVSALTSTTATFQMSAGKAGIALCLKA